VSTTFLGRAKSFFYALHLSGGEHHRAITPLVALDHNNVADPLAQHMSCQFSRMAKVVYTVVAFVDESIHSGIAHVWLSYVAERIIAGIGNLSTHNLLKKLHNVAGSHRVSFHTLHYQVGIAQPLNMGMIVPVVDAIFGDAHCVDPYSLVVKPKS
jgi:hypothetical protein